MTWPLLGPMLVPLGAAVLALFALPWPTAQRWIGVAGCALQCVLAFRLLGLVDAAGAVAGQIGGWPAPFGITVIADRLSALMIALAAAVGLAVAVYGLAAVGEAQHRHGFQPLYQALLFGVAGAVLAGDVFNLYVWFEVMLIASFALMALGGEPRRIDGAIKYAVVNLASTTLILLGVAALYGLTGTLNLADLAVRLPEVGRPGLVSAVAIVFMVAFGAKAAVFPLFFGVPAAYHTVGAATAAIFAGLLTKVGVYALVRMFTLVFTGSVGYTHGLLLWVAGLTMLVGVTASAVQTDVRRLLSFQIIGHIGYMIMGLALFTPLAIAGALFYLLHDAIVKTALFLVGGLASRLTGSADLRRMGGLYRGAPAVSVLFLILALALSGVPPLSGFWAKLILVRAALAEGGWTISAVALVASVLTLYAMSKVWLRAFWAPHPAGPVAGAESLPPGQRIALLTPIVLLTAVVVLMGLWSRPFFAFAERAAAGLLDPLVYIAAVRGAP